MSGRIVEALRSRFRRETKSPEQSIVETQPELGLHVSDVAEATLTTALVAEVLQLADPVAVEPLPQPVEAPKSAEIEVQPVDVLIVTADDAPGQRRKNSQAAAKAMMQLIETKGSTSTSRIVEVNSAKGLLRHVLMGNGGNQAQLVLLDNNYSEDHRNWVMTPGLIEEWAAIANIPIAQLENPRTGKLNHLFDGLLYPSAINFAVLLRLFGFQGKIVAVTNDPPSIANIDREWFELKEMFPERTFPFPIDGISLKAAHRFGSSWLFMYAKAIRDRDHEWDTEDLLTTDFAEVLQVFLDDVVPPGNPPAGV